MSALLSFPSRAQEAEEEQAMSAEWLSVIETATRLNLHTSTVYKHLHRGTFPCLSMRVGRAWRIRSADVDILAGQLRALLAEADSGAYASVLSALVEQS